MFGAVDRVLAHPWIRIASLMATIVGVGFLGWGVWVAWNSLDPSTGGVSWLWLPVAVAGVSLTHVGSVGMMTIFLREMGLDRSFGDVFAAVLASNLAKYVPGGIWQVGSHLQWFQRVGVPAREASLLYGLNAMASVGGASFAGAVFWLAVGEGPTWLWWLVGLAAVAGLALLLPPVRWWIVERVRGEVRHPGWRVGVLASLLGAIVGLSLAFHGAAVAEMVEGFGATPAQAGGALALSWVVGFLFLVSPNGLGAREAALLLLLSPWVSPVAIAGFAALSRLVFLVADSISGAVAGGLAKSRPTRPRPPDSD